MTTKLKAKKYRTPQPVQAKARAADPKLNAKLAETPAEENLLPSVDEQGETPDIGPRPTPANSNAEQTPEAAIAAIRKEGLTGRQLRMARRTAQKNGLAATSDFDAVRLLREKGIDPFQRSNMLELANTGKKGAELAKIDKVQLPQTVSQDENLPSTEVEDPALRRANDIEKIQRDIVRRRQKRMTLLGVRLAFFVALPALVCGWYFYNIATPMYSTKSSFLIQQNEAQPLAPSSGLGGLMGGGPLATVQDSIAVQGYLTSEAAMRRLDGDLGFKAHFSGEDIDPLSRLSEDATDAAAFSIYKKNVKIGYDPTEGILNMEVIAADPKASEEFSKALIGYAEEQVSDLTLRLREDQMRGARESFQEAEMKRAEALQQLTRLQQELQVVDPIGENAAIQGQISALEGRLSDFRLNLAAQLSNPRPNAAKVDAIRRQIRSLEDEVSSLRAKLTVDNNRGGSIATKTAQLRVAEADYETRNLMLQTALQSLETSRTAADRQARYLAQAIPPVAPDEPSYPRKFENTILAFLIFGGIYLMMSLTASILREQV